MGTKQLLPFPSTSRPTTSVVLAGELHVTDFDSAGNEVGTRIRAGDYSHTATPDVHMECGPDGAVVLSIFSLPMAT